MIDSGSSDRSREIAARRRRRAAGEIAPAEFGHGRTRNLGAELTSGDLICFLTQDATPVPGWLDAYRAAFALDPRVGAAYGPHLPRPDTSPMIARELTEFFASMSPDGGTVCQRAARDHVPLQRQRLLRARLPGGDRLPRRPLLRGPGVRRDMLEAGWVKVYHPRRRCCTPTTTARLEFMRRYFDEYRGLRETIGHVEPLSLRGALAHARSPAATCAGWASTASAPRARALGGALAQPTTSAGACSRRSARAPTGCRGRCAARLSLEGRDDAPQPRTARRRTTTLGPAAVGRHRRPAAAATHQRAEYEPVARVSRDGAVPLLEPRARHGRSRAAADLRCCCPSSARAAAGTTCFQQCSLLERRGHTCSVWVARQRADARVRVAGRAALRIRELFAASRRPSTRTFDAWQGADVVVRDRLADRPPGAALDHVPGARLPRHRPRARVLRDLRRVAGGAGHLPPRAALRLREPLAARHPARALRR